MLGPGVQDSVGIFCIVKSQEGFKLTMFQARRRTCNNKIKTLLDNGQSRMSTQTMQSPVLHTQANAAICIEFDFPMSFYSAAGYYDVVDTLHFRSHTEYLIQLRQISSCGKEKFQQPRR